MFKYDIDFDSGPATTTTASAWSSTRPGRTASWRAPGRCWRPRFTMDGKLQERVPPPAQRQAGILHPGRPLAEDAPSSACRSRIARLSSGFGAAPAPGAGHACACTRAWTTPPAPARRSRPPATHAWSFVGWKGGYGRTVILDHGRGHTTLYGHMSRFGKDQDRPARVAGHGDRLRRQHRPGHRPAPALRIPPQRRALNPLTMTLPPPEPLSGAALVAFKSETGAPGQDPRGRGRGVPARRRQSRGEQPEAGRPQERLSRAGAMRYSLACPISTCTAVPWPDFRHQRRRHRCRAGALRRRHRARAARARLRPHLSLGSDAARAAGGAGPAGRAHLTLDEVANSTCASAARSPTRPMRAIADSGVPRGELRRDRLARPDPAPPRARRPALHPAARRSVNVIAERCGITTVADFRRRDVAAGGQGAPLVPAFHAARCMHSPDEDRAVLNLGGIANLTLLPAQGTVRGFDTGPANGLMDAWCLRHTGHGFDAGGAFAATGRVDDALLARLLDEPWFALPPPKSHRPRPVPPRLGGLASWMATNPPADVQATLLRAHRRAPWPTRCRPASPATRRLHRLRWRRAQPGADGARWPTRCRAWHVESSAAARTRSGLRGGDGLRVAGAGNAGEPARATCRP